MRFRYSGQPQDALSGVNLVVRPGETVALVGQTGAGKSTMVKLVARYYDVSSGSLLIDGTDVRELDLAGYRQQLGVVPQEPYLFPGTVRDAIAYGRPDATDAEVEAAAREVGAVEMIARLPGGFRHEVAERGRNLAAGQRQLIALARAYLVDPAILLLDEATAALDLASEAAVNTATERLTRQAHHLGGRAPADHRRPRRPHRGDGVRQDRRGRHPRRAAEAGRQLRGAVGRVHRGCRAGCLTRSDAGWARSGARRSPR